jgi:hypothetical protein
MNSRLAAIGLIAIYLLAGLVEPCDGHSCKGDEWTNSGINTNLN